MSERIQGTNENFITRLNYNRYILGLFSAAAFGTLAIGTTYVEDGPNNFPPYIQGHATDFVVIPAYIGLTQAVSGSQNRLLAGLHGLSFGVVAELTQHYRLKAYLGLTPGVADIRDVVASAAGVALWVAFDTSARMLHDSGACLPIYRFLGIRHRRFPDA